MGGQSAGQFRLMGTLGRKGFQGHYQVQMDRFLGPQEEWKLQGVSDEGDSNMLSFQVNKNVREWYAYSFGDSFRRAIVNALDSLLLMAKHKNLIN